MSTAEIPVGAVKATTGPDRPVLESISDGHRLAALRDLAILDTEPEESYDRFTALTADLLGAPVALVSMIDRDRQFFKSQLGLPKPWAQARQVPLSHSLCQHVVAAKRPLVVADARQSALLAGNLAVRDLDAIAYLGVPLILADGNPVGTLCAIDRRPRQWTKFELRVIQDLAEAVRTQLDLRRSMAERSLHDRVTGLPNRALVVAFCDHLRATRRDRRMAALAIGVDELGAINRARGISHSDRILKRIARRIAWQLSGEDLLGRAAPYTFIVVRPEIEGERDALALGQRIREAICGETLTVSGESLSVGATVGIAYSTDDGAGEQLLADAEAAMAEARADHGRADTSAPEGPTGTPGAGRIRGALGGAIARDEISVAFQPIVELETGNTRGFEALARWRHPELGEVSPESFIDVAESTGEVVAIGEHVLRTACRQLAAWRSRFNAQLHVTVNLSPLQLSVANIADVIQGILDESGIPAPALSLEITERVVLSPGVLELRTLARLRELGVRIALDDFGTGYSTLSYLKQFAVDVIKIDRSLLEDRRADFRDEALVRAILALGSAMQIEVVAEGVETDAQRELLYRSGCRWGQGYLFARPLPAAEVAIGPGGITPGVAALETG